MIFLKALEFNMESNMVVTEGGSVIKFENCDRTAEALEAYAEELAINHPEVVVIKPILAWNNSGDKFEYWKALDEYGLPCVTVEDLGLDIKPLKKEDIKMHMKIETVVDGLEADVKEAMDKIIANEDGDVNRVKRNLQDWIAKGGDAYEWIKTKLEMISGVCFDSVNNSYAKLNGAIYDKVQALIKKQEGDTKENIFKRVGKFVLATVLEVIAGLLGLVKFAGDMVISIAKYIGCTVITITKGVGTVCKEVVESFKADLIAPFKKPVVEPVTV